MNYLLVEGYKQGAQKFEKESGIKGKFLTQILASSSNFIMNTWFIKMHIAEIDEELIDSRTEIRKLIQSGHIEEAINKINNLNPEVIF